MIGGYFHTEKSFLLPAGLDGVRAIASKYWENDGAVLLIAGHTDTAGNADYDDKLSLERAEAPKDCLTQNVAGWLAWYDSAKPSEKRWGAQEDEAMIEALPDAGTRDPNESAVRWYRRTRGMQTERRRFQDGRRVLAGRRLVSS